MLQRLLQIAIHKILLVLILLAPLSIVSQEIPETFSFPESDYPGINQNWMITQDYEGRIYVANSSGILIFNGFQWTKVELPNQLIARSVFCAKDSTIYAGGYEVFGTIDVKNDNSYTFKVISDKIPDSEIEDQEMWNILEFDSKIFLQSFSNTYIISKDTIKTIIPPTNIMLGNSINDKLYIPSIQSGIFTFKNERFSLIQGSEQLPVESRIAGIVPSDNQKQLIIGTQYQGIFIFENNNFKKLDSRLNEELKKYRLNKIIKLSNGNYAIGTILNGLYILDKQLELKYHINKSKGLLNNTVLSLFEDNDKKLWIGLDKGLNVVNLNSTDLFYYDFPGNLGTIYTACNFNNNLYLGTNQGLFIRSQDGRFELIKNSQGQVWDLAITDFGLLCCHNNGIYRVNNKSFNPISEETGKWKIEKVDNEIYLLSSYTGLTYLTRENNKFIVNKISHSNHLIKDFEIINEIIIGIHPQKGLFSFRWNKSETTIEETEIEILDSLKSEKFTSITKHDSTIYLFTANKVYRVNLPLTKIFAFKITSDLSGINDDPPNSVLIKNSSNTPEFKIFNIDNGYIRSKISKNQVDKSPNIRIEKIFVNGNLVSLENINSLKTNQNNITIFLGTDEPISDIDHIKYKLGNYDKSWRNIPETGIIQARNLVSGNYELVLNNIKKDEKISLTKFSVQPPFYLSGIAFISYLILLLLISYILYKQHLRRLRKTELKLMEEQSAQLEKQQIKSRNEQLEQELKYKSKMLANNAMTLIQKNNMLKELKIHLKKAKEENNSIEYQKINKLINRNIKSDEDWEIFERNFADVHESFFKNLETDHPELTSGDLRLAAYIKMNLSSKEIAPLLNISIRSVENKRYRLRKKLGLEHKDSLFSYLMRL